MDKTIVKNVDVWMFVKVRICTPSAKTEWMATVTLENRVHTTSDGAVCPVERTRELLGVTESWTR